MSYLVNTKKFYDWIHKTSPKRWEGDPIDLVVKNYLKKFEGKKIKLADLGCGSGHTLDLLARPEWEMKGLDYSEAGVELAKRRLGNRAEIVLGDMTKSPFKDEEFDVVISLGSFEHLEEIDFRDAYRITKKGGMFILNVPISEESKGRIIDITCYDKESDDWGGHYSWWLTDEQWGRALEETGFTIEDFKHEIFFCRK